MIVQLDASVRKITMLLAQGKWSEATQKMWADTALPIFLDFVQRNKHPDIAQHVVQTVLDELSQQINTPCSHIEFQLEPSNILAGHSLQLLCVPHYCVLHCANEVARLQHMVSSKGVGRK